MGMNHAHVDAALAASVATVLVYLVKWGFGLEFPEILFFLPTFITVWLAFYVPLYVVFWILWMRG